MTPDQFRAFLTMQGLADGTIRTYSSFYTRWHGHPGGSDWPDRMWTPGGVREWSRTLPRSRASLEQARTVVARALEAAELDGLEELPKAIVIPRAARKRRSKALHDDEAVALHRAACDAGVKGLAVLVGLYTAGRRAEIASLAWANVDLDRAEVTLTRPKNRDEHTVPLHPVLAANLQLNHVDGQRWVFPGTYGGHAAPATIWSWVKDVAEKAGVDGVHPHRLRHTCLTEIVDRTGDLRAAQEIAGHVSPTVTAAYTRAGEKAKRGAIDVLGEAYGAAA